MDYEFEILRLKIYVQNFHLGLKFLDSGTYALRESLNLIIVYNFFFKILSIFLLPLVQNKKHWRTLVQKKNFFFEFLNQNEPVQQ